MASLVDAAAKPLSLDNETNQQPHNIDYVASDAAELAQQLKARLLPDDKAVTKNQKKKARKKISKLVQQVKGLHLPANFASQRAR